MSRSESPYRVDGSQRAAAKEAMQDDQPPVLDLPRRAQLWDRTQLQHLSIASTFPAFRHKRFSPSQAGAEGAAAARMLSQHRRNMVLHKQMQQGGASKHKRRSLSPQQRRSLSPRGPKTVYEAISETIQPAMRVWDPESRLAALLAPPGSRVLQQAGATRATERIGSAYLLPNQGQTCAERALGERHSDAPAAECASPFPHILSRAAGQPESTALLSLYPGSRSRSDVESACVQADIYASKQHSSCAPDQLAEAPLQVHIPSDSEGSVADEHLLPPICLSDSTRAQGDPHHSWTALKANTPGTPNSPHLAASGARFNGNSPGSQYAATRPSVGVNGRLSAFHGQGTDAEWGSSQHRRSSPIPPRPMATDRERRRSSHKSIQEVDFQGEEHAAPNPAALDTTVSCDSNDVANDGTEGVKAVQQAKKDSDSVAESSHSDSSGSESLGDGSKSEGSGHDGDDTRGQRSNVKKQELGVRLLAGSMSPAMFASALLCMSRERQNKVLTKLVADAALKGNLRRIYVSHLEAMASVLSPSGMALAAHVYKGFEITPESDWPAPYHVAMTQGCEVARAQPVEEVDECLQVCHHAVEAAVSRSTLEKAHRQLLDDRTRYAQALLAASKGVLQASGNLKDIERKLNQTVAKLSQCQYVSVVAYYDPGSWYLTAGGTRHPLQDDCMATQVLRRDSQVEMGSLAGKKWSNLDQERFAAHAVYSCTSALGTPVRLQPTCNTGVTSASSQCELVGAIVAVNKLQALGGSPEILHDKDGFSDADKALFQGIAEQLGTAFKLATRQAIVQTAQSDHVESIVSATSVIAGLRLVQAAFPTGAMWAAVEAHAAWLVNCSEARLYAPSAAADSDSDGTYGSAAVRRCKESDWGELLVEDAEYDVFKNAWMSGIARTHGVHRRAQLLLPLHTEYLDVELLQLPSFDVTGPASGPLRSRAATDPKPGKPGQRVPWAVLVCSGKEKEGVGFAPQDKAVLREWGMLFRTSLQTAGLLLQQKHM